MGGLLFSGSVRQQSREEGVFVEEDHAKSPMTTLQTFKKPKNYPQTACYTKIHHFLHFARNSFKPKQQFEPKHKAEQAMNLMTLSFPPNR